MRAKRIKDDVFWVGAVDWDRRLFDSLIPLPYGTSYNAYLVKGSEKTALIDSVDPSMKDVLLSHLEGADVIDFIVSNHSEQDHSGVIPELLGRYRDAKVVATPKGKTFLIEHLHIDGERIVTVSDGERLSLGNKTLEFIHTPWVHWPETMVSYLHEDRILFTCDLFGSHIATSCLYSSEDWRVCDAAKRYYAEVMMPFRATIRRHMERFNKYQFDIIAPSHGPVHNEPSCIIESHREWVSERLSNTVVLPYVSMHGSTQLMVDYLTDILSENGIKVERFNLKVTDTGELAMALVDAATMVIGSPMVLSGAHPFVVSAVFMANALRPKVKFASIIGSFGWGGRMVEQLKALMSNLRVEMLEPVLARGLPDDECYKSIRRLASEIAARHKRIVESYKGKG